MTGKDRFLAGYNGCGFMCRDRGRKWQRFRACEDGLVAYGIMTVVIPGVRKLSPGRRGAMTGPMAGRPGS